MNAQTAKRDTDRMTIGDFIARHSLTMTAEWADANPAMENSQLMNHWRCVIRCGRDQRRRMTVVFSMGLGIIGQPKLRDVLDCLAADAAGIENAQGDFASWASEYGFDTDSRKAERTFRACQRQAQKLERMLSGQGDDAFNTLLFNTERE